MEKYTRNLIKLGDGQLAAEYVAGITEALVDQDWDSEPSILRKHMGGAQRNDEGFLENAAKILGWWTSERHFALHFNQFALPELNSELLAEKPDNLGPPIFLDSDSQSGRQLWLVKSYIHPLAVRIP